MALVYLAGKMRGVPEFNFPAFTAATDQLRAAGHTVFNPAERDLRHGFDPTGLTGHEDLAALGFNLRDALEADLRWICRFADAVALLPGWQTSRGARAEVATAETLGLDIWHVTTDAGHLERSGGILDVGYDYAGAMSRMVLRGPWERA